MPDGSSFKQPQTVADLLAQRTSMRGRSLHDDVDDIFLRLWEVLDFRRLFDSVHPSQTVEGSFAADEFLSAQMVRQFAVEHNFVIAKDARLAALLYSLNVVSRRYGQSRTQRRNMVKGERVDMRDETNES